MKSQLVAQEALLFAVIETLNPEHFKTLRLRFELHAEEAKTEVLNSMATDELYERLLEHLEKYSKTISNSD
ncbi:MAG: hypothetical protein RR715_05345 [Comamonas sp.]|uniref:hypothetical protein n=1 Tax=unclassified Comamonas TaxID=2638500 RepID=UPI001F097DB6|nr:hypothetical protein [Comamonas sp. lk]